VEFPFDARCNCLRYDHNRRVSLAAGDFVIVCRVFANGDSHFSLFYTCNRMCKLTCINRYGNHRNFVVSVATTALSALPDRGTMQCEAFALRDSAREKKPRARRGLLVLR
jgi:hypothetical protein